MITYEMGALGRRRLALGAVAVIALAASVEYAWSSEEAFPTNPNAEVELFELANQERRSRGLRPLAEDPVLLEVARRHSSEMARDGQISHNHNLQNEVGEWIKLGENVGRGSSASLVHEAFMGSSVHRRQILDRDYAGMAVGVTVGSEMVWVTQLFVLRPGQPAVSSGTSSPRPRAAPQPGPQGQAPPDPPPPPIPQMIDANPLLRPYTLRLPANLPTGLPLEPAPLRPAALAFFLLVADLFVLKGLALRRGPVPHN